MDIKEVVNEFYTRLLKFKKEDDGIEPIVEISYSHYTAPFNSEQWLCQLHVTFIAMQDEELIKKKVYTYFADTLDELYEKVNAYIKDVEIKNELPVDM